VTRPLILPVCALLSAMLLAGCGGDIFSSETKLFPQAGNMFATRDWSAPPPAAEIAVTRTVTPEDYVDANGACAVGAPSEPAVARAGDPGSNRPASNVPPSLTGGIGLNMTECQVVQRAGQPGSVEIGAENTERKVVLTYKSGSWPGIYTFVGGRLKTVDAVAMPEPVKPAAKKRAAKPKTAATSR
jgi:hypothetical protein